MEIVLSSQHFSDYHPRLPELEQRTASSKEHPQTTGDFQTRVKCSWLLEI